MYWLPVFLLLIVAGQPPGVRNKIHVATGVVF